jgi:hypothetical protein
MNSVLLFFIDGLGIGTRGWHNPLSLAENLAPLAVFHDEEPKPIFDGALSRADACLGIDGRPQSASGQTTILTGVNVPQTLGYHKQGFPNAAMREILARDSIFLQLKNMGVMPNVFANAYTPKFFTETPRWKSATTCAVEAAEMKFRTLDDLLENRAVYHDFTNSVLRARGFPDFPLRSPQEAGNILAGLTKQHRFTLYEYFITDKIGHDQDFELAAKVLPALAECARSLLENVDLNKTTVILTSDHGNIEDLSARNHTLNLVPTWVWGRENKQTANTIKSLADVTPAIVNLLKKG